MQEFKYLQRCKPRAYFDDILKNKKGIMEPYIKDNTGHMKNGINKRINGKNHQRRGQIFGFFLKIQIFPVFLKIRIFSKFDFSRKWSQRKNFKIADSSKGLKGKAIVKTKK